MVGAGGGPEKTIINSPRFLEHDGYPMVLAYMRSPDDAGFAALEQRAAERNADLVAIDDNGPFDWGIVRRFRELCERLQPTIWHAHDYKSDLIGLLLRRHFPNMHLVTTTHGYVERTWKLPAYYAIDKWCLPRYEHVVCVSEDLYETVTGLGVPASRCTFVPNGIDTDEFRRLRPSVEAKREAGVPDGRMVVGAVGRLSAEKGFDMLIKAFSRVLASTDTDAELWILGEGRERPNLEQLIADLGLGDRVKLMGFRTDTLELYQCMDAYALSSLREGLPNVVLEAMATGVPLVATRTAGVPSVVEDGESGLLLDPGDEDALTDRLSRLMTSRELRERLAAGARKTIEERYSFALRMSRIKRIYDQVTGRAESGADPS